ncbi:DUF6268 family outer membrane beta-barrel protein [Polaribacter sp.]|nr:DUF6268 family outer membrane beta-barrel protein [Polaribacter sp.]
MKKKKQNLLLLFVLSSLFASAQLTDLARVEYSFIPKHDSKDQYTRLRLLLNYPTEVKEDAYLVVGAEYNRIHLNLRDDYPFDKNTLETLTIIDFNLAYTYKMNEKWRVAFKVSPRIASTFNEKITGDDLFLNGGIYFIKDRRRVEEITKPYRLILGLTYNTTAGIPFPLPIISYFRKLNEKWTYSIGVPKMNIKHLLSEKQTIQAFASLDGYFAHVQKPTMIQGESIDNISLSVAVTGVGYEYFLSDHVVWYTYLGYTARMSNVLRNADRKSCYYRCSCFDNWT